MKEYVDIEVLKQQDFQDFSNTDVMHAIDYCPRADVEPVVHAYWEKECRSEIIFPSGESAMLIERKCSNCHLWSDKEILTYYLTPAKRCSECGAKMDGDKTNEN